MWKENQTSESVKASIDLTKSRFVVDNLHTIPEVIHMIYSRFSVWLYYISNATVPWQYLLDPTYYKACL